MIKIRTPCDAVFFYHTNIVDIFKTRAIVSINSFFRQRLK